MNLAIRALSTGIAAICLLICSLYCGADKVTEETLGSCPKRPPTDFRGPPGIPGKKGDKGERGEINDTHHLEMTEMEKTISEMKRNIAELTRTLRTVTFETLCYVGIKDGRIPNSAMTASSVWNDGYNAFYGRLDNTGNPGGFWHPAENQADNQWLQVDFGTPIRVVGVITQGRPNFDYWVTSYKILYGNSTSNLVSIRNQESNRDKVFDGNHNRSSKVTNTFPQPITARYFRILVVAYNNEYPVLRIEYLTC